MSISDFSNTNWSPSSNDITDGRLSFTVGATITLYSNDDFEDYVDFLENGQAATFIDSGDADLTQTRLSGFTSKITSYDGYSIMIQADHSTV